MKRACRHVRTAARASPRTARCSSGPGRRRVLLSGQHVHASFSVVPHRTHIRQLRTHLLLKGRPERKRQPCAAISGRLTQKPGAATAERHEHRKSQPCQAAGRRPRGARPRSPLGSLASGACLRLSVIPVGEEPLSHEKAPVREDPRGPDLASRRDSGVGTCSATGAARALGRGPASPLFA